MTGPLLTPLIPPILALLAAPHPSPSPASPPRVDHLHATRGAAQDPLEGLERLRGYLARSPYHGPVFERLVEDAVASGVLDELVADYEAQLARDEDPGAAPRILLARLYARTERGRKALELLASLEPETDPERAARRALLAARLAADEGELARAADLQEEAAELAPDADLAREALRALARTARELGQEQRARAAFGRLAASAPQDYATRLDVAEAMAETGLGAAAADEFRAAVGLARDPARRAAALAALGAHLETLHRGEEALDAYAEARALTARGSWLRRDLEERELRLHAAGGTLAVLAASRRAALDAAPTEPGAREELARALAWFGDGDAALGVLEEATRAFPRDTELSRELRALLRASGRAEGALRELQRLAAERPRDAELGFELATEFAAAGRNDAAAERFAALLAGRPADAALHIRIASAWSAAGRGDRARAAYEAALASDPRAARAYTDLALLLENGGERGAALAVLVRGEHALDDDPGGLAELARLYRRLDERRSAARAFTRALVSRPDDPDLLEPLAEIEAALGRHEAARARLQRLIEVAGDSTRRSVATDRYVELARTEADVERLIGEHEAALAEDPGRRAPYLLLAALHVRRGRSPETDAASMVLERYLERWPDDVAARTRLAERLTLLGRTHRALKHYNLLIEAEPRLSASFLLAKARIYVQQGHDARALASLRGARARSARSVELLTRVAEAYGRIGRKDLAREALEQARRVDPGHAPTAFALAELLLEGRRTRPLEPEARSAALDALLASYRGGDARTARRALLHMRALYGEANELGAVLAELARRMRASPYDTEAPDLLVDLLLLEERHEEAREVLLTQLEKRPDDPRLLSRRSRALVREARYDEALGDVRRLRELGEDVDNEVADLLPYFLRSARVAGEERLEEALAMGAWVLDPLPFSQELLRAGLYREAIAYLRGWADGAGLADEAVIELLARHHRFMDDPSFAVQVLEAQELRAGATIDTTTRLGALYHEMGLTEKVLECGRRLLALDAPPRDIEVFFETKELREELTRLRAERLAGEPLSFDRIDEGLERFLGERYDAPGALALAALLRERLEARGVRPQGWARDAWRAYLDSFELALFRRNARLVGPEMRRLLERAERGEELSARDWMLLLRLAHFPGAGPRPPRGEAPPAGPAVDPRLVERALLAHPDDLAVLTAAALALEDADRNRRAGELFDVLADRLDGGETTPEHRALVEWLAGAERRERERFLLPRTVREDRADPEHWTRLCRVAIAPPITEARPLSVLSRAGALRRAARCVALTGDRDGARRRLEQSTPVERDDLAGWADLADAWHAAGLDAEARAALGHLVTLRTELASDPDLGRLSDVWDLGLRARIERLGTTLALEALLGVD